MRRKLIAVGAGLLAALTMAAGQAAADPPAKNPHALDFTVTCPGMDSFQVRAVGAPGFVQGQRLLVINQAPGQGSLDLVECSATNPQVGTITVFLQFVQRG